MTPTDLIAKNVPYHVMHVLPITPYSYKHVYEMVLKGALVTPEEINGKSRVTHIRQARQILHYQLNKALGMTTVAIGKLTHKDHTSVIHSIRIVETELASPAQTALKELYNKIFGDKKWTS